MTNLVDHRPAVFSGDWHGLWNKAIREIKRLDLRDCVIIQVGDFGAGFEHEKKFIGAMRMLSATLRPRNMHVFAIRGNHDNPSFFDGRTYECVTLLQDYTIISAASVKILCVGGAISIDRLPNPEDVDYTGKSWKGRKEGVNYWRDEPFVLNTNKIPVEQIDIIVTHSAPLLCRPISKHGIETWMKYDESLSADVDKERSDLSMLAAMVPSSEWYYGHFHQSGCEIIDGTMYVLLDELEFRYSNFDRTN